MSVPVFMGTWDASGAATVRWWDAGTTVNLRDFDAGELKEGDPLSVAFAGCLLRHDPLPVVTLM